MKPHLTAKELKELIATVASQKRARQLSGGIGTSSGVNLKNTGGKPVNTEARLVISKPAGAKVRAITAKSNSKAKLAKCEVCGVFFHISIHDHINTPEHKAKRILAMGA